MVGWTSHLLRLAVANEPRGVGKPRGCLPPRRAPGSAGAPRLASDDLRDPLMAQAHGLSDGLHRQPFAVGEADGLVALSAQALGLRIQGGCALRVVLGEGCQALFGAWGLAFSASDQPIV